MSYSSLNQHIHPQGYGSPPSHDAKYVESSQTEPPTYDSPQVSHNLYIPSTEAPREVRIRGATRNICIAFLMITVPMTAFVALLLGLVRHYRVQGGDAMSPNFEAGTKNEAGVIYVNFSATIFTTVASWSSTVAPLLLTFIISLSSFPTARRLLDASQSPGGSELPTPFQFSLILAMLEKPGISTLGRLLKYKFSWKSRASQGTAMGFLSGVLCVGLFFSTLVFVTDTWLHFTTETVSFTQVSPLNTRPNASFDLVNGDSQSSQQCYNVTWPEYGQYRSSMSLDDLKQCTMYFTGDSTSLFGAISMGLLSNSSTDGAVKMYLDGNGTNFAYLGVPARTDLDNIDFAARTWALSSSCTPVTKDCVFSTSQANAEYNCSSIALDSYIDTTSVNEMTMQYYASAAMRDLAPANVSAGNPYYYAAVASVNQNARRSDGGFQNDGGVFAAPRGAFVIVVACSTTVWDVEYTSTNGSISRFIASPSNTSMANIMMGTQWFTGVATPFLTQSFSTGAWIASSPQGIADRFASDYSFAALSLGGNAMTPTLATEAQYRTEMLVARVPLAPLAALVASNLLLVILGLVLTVWAIVAARGDVSEVQARLGLVALVGNYFEGEAAQRPVRNIEDIFGEKSGLAEKKVNIFKTLLEGWVIGVGSV